MYVLDTTHLLELEHPGPRSAYIRVRLEALDYAPVTTIVSLYEVLRNYLGNIHKLDKNPTKQALQFTSLHKIFLYYSAWNILPFDNAAVAKYEELVRQGLLIIGSRDLKIAAIVLCRDATLITANYKD